MRIGCRPLQRLILLLSNGNRPPPLQGICFFRTLGLSPLAAEIRSHFGAQAASSCSHKVQKSVELQLVKCIGPAFPIRLIWTPFAETFFEGHFLEPFNGCNEKKRPKVFRFLRVIFQNREHFCIGPGDSKRQDRTVRGPEKQRISAKNAVCFHNFLISNA